MGTDANHFEGFSQKELQNLKALAQEVDETADGLDTTRRDVIKSLGLVGTGIAAGGISAKQLINEVSAQASPSDSDGNVGSPTDVVDVFADGIIASSIQTDKANITDTSTDPSTNGDITRNGADVKVSSGGSVKNLSNVGTTEKLVTNPTRSKVNTAVQNLNPDDRLVVLGDWDCGSTIDVNVDRPQIECYGTVTNTGTGLDGVFKFGTDNTTPRNGGRLFISQLIGQGQTDSNTGIRVQNHSSAYLDFNRIARIENPVVAQSEKVEDEPLDWIVTGSKIENCYRAISFYTEYSYIQGWVILGTNVFEVEDSDIKHDDSGGGYRSTLHTFYGMTLHGNTDPNNVQAIHYNAASTTEANKYDLKFLGGTDNSKSQSTVEFLN